MLSYPVLFFSFISYALSCVYNKYLHVFFKGGIIIRELKTFASSLAILGLVEGTQRQEVPDLFRLGTDNVQAERKLFLIVQDKGYQIEESCRIVLMKMIKA